MKIRQQVPLWVGLATLLLAMISPAAPAGNNAQNVKIVTFNDPDGISMDNFGASVALSGDGSTALIGAFNAVESGVNAGKAYIYTRSNGTWSANPTATFIDPALQTLDKFGSYVTLSTDGSAALVGDAVMTVYVYGKVNGVWATAPSAVLNDPDSNDGGIFGDCFGCALALSADGNTALVGASGVNENGNIGVGKAYIFIRSNGIWSSIPVATFSDPGAVNLDDFGNSVALSADGKTALIGTGHLLGAGRAFVFTQNNGIWNTTPVATFDISGKNDLLGSSVALSAAGEVALVGAQGVNNGTGIAYIYQTVNGVWPNLPTMTFSAPTVPAGDQFGVSVALSSDGTIAAIAGNSNLNMFVQLNDTWATQPSSRLTNPDNTGFGSGDVALSSVGDAVLIGFPDPGNCIILPPNPVPCNPAGPGQAFLFETSNDWANPSPAPAPATASNSGGGSFDWLSLILILGLALRHRLWRQNPPVRD